jgi:hypothetical protein
MMFVDDIANRGHARDLGRFLVQEMELNSVTLAVANDTRLASNPDRNFDSDWFMWTLHSAAIEGFNQGCVSTIRFAHPEHYRGTHDTFDFSLFSTIEDMLLGDQPALQRPREDYMLNYVPETFGAVQESARAIWKSCGYSLEHDGCGISEQGTVLILRRVKMAEADSVAI